MSGDLEVRVERPAGGPARVTVAGEIDLGNVERLRSALEDGPGVEDLLVVDLGAVTYIDSAGIAALFARATQGPLEVRFRADSVVAPLVEITRLGEVARIREAPGQEE